MNHGAEIQDRGIQSKYGVGQNTYFTPCHPTPYYIRFYLIPGPSLVPRPDPPEKEGPGIHCLRMRLISPKSWENRGLSCYIRATMTSNFGYR